MAAAYMKCRGYSVLSRNWRSRRGEIDLVCSGGEEIVFVEVKTREDTNFGLPGDALTPKKSRRLVRAASLYLSQNDLWASPCRFDLVSVSLQEGGCEIRHDRDVISHSEHGAALGGGYTHWQPW
jgi:putative endonuclease